MLNDLTSYVFAVMMGLVGLAGFVGVAYVLVSLLEIFLPESWKAANLARNKEQHKATEVRNARIAAAREKIRKIQPRMSQIELLAERLARAPVTEKDLSLAIGRAVEQRAYEEMDLTPELSSVGEEVPAKSVEPVAVPKRIQRVCICRFPLTEHSEYLGGFIKGKPIWTPRAQAKVFFTNSDELADALRKSGKNSPTEIFVLLAGSGEIQAKAQPQPKAKAASA